MRFLKVFTQFIVTCATVGVFTPNVQAQSKTDDLVLEMNQAFRQSDRAKLTRLLPQVRGHALEPWAAYWEIKARLNNASASEVQGFLQKYAGTYQEDRLRNDWLLLLGQRRDWQSFATEYPRYRMGDDKEVRCYALNVNFLQQGNADHTLVAEARKLWWSQREADDGCTYLVGALYDAQKISAADIWRKARQSVEANKLRAATQAVQIVHPKLLGQMNEALGNPQKFLKKNTGAQKKMDSELITLTLIKIATNDPDSASGLLTTWGATLNASQRNAVWASIGRQLALKLRDEAVHAYAKVSHLSDLNDDQLAWKARAALRSNRWKDVLQAIESMSTQASKDSAWVYWRAKSMLTLGRSESERLQSLELFQNLAGPWGFYEQLALEELGQPVNVPAKPAPLSEQERQNARTNLGLNRALYAIFIGLRGEGVREWNYTTNLHTPGGMNERELLAAADFACERKVWDRCINTSDRTKTMFDYEQRYPMPFKDAVLERSRSVGLDPAYVYGLIRQESRFIMDARSHVGASGLMQLMPATARWTAKKIGLNDFDPKQVNEHDTNIALGTAYLKLALDEFSGSMPMAAAAYNAGPNRPRAWRNGPVLDAAIWIENIPFTETRDYVKKVLANTTVYASVIDAQPQSLKTRLGRVSPSNTRVATNYDMP